MAPLSDCSEESTHKPQANIVQILRNYGSAIIEHFLSYRRHRVIEFYR